jgi:DNA-binding XRE family transcriptional regulator
MPNILDTHLLTPTLIKAARALLNWDQVELAERVGISRKTVSLIEAASGTPSDPRRIAVLVELSRVLQAECGVEFTFASRENGEGVRLLRPRA